MKRALDQRLEIAGQKLRGIPVRGVFRSLASQKIWQVGHKMILCSTRSSFDLCDLEKRQNTSMNTMNAVVIFSLQWLSWWTKETFQLKLLLSRVDSFMMLMECMGRLCQDLSNHGSHDVNRAINLLRYNENFSQVNYMKTLVILDDGPL